MFKKEIKMQILALFLLSIGGLMLHLCIHAPTHSIQEALNPPSRLATLSPPTVWNWAPLAVCVMSAFVLPFLFNSSKTVALAFVLNTAAVIIGTIGMAAFSIKHWNPQVPVTVPYILFQTLLMDIIILWAKFPLGLSILRHFRPAAPRPM